MTYQYMHFSNKLVLPKKQTNKKKLSDH